ncbi:MAG: YhgE/Pip family protein [Ruminiclostridium sp.]
MQKIKKYKIITVVFAVIVIPLVYSFFYLDAFWDPYSKLDKLPVAVVNQDSGALINGKSRNLGTEITDRIKTDKNLKWVVTSDSDAKEGVENRRYYASIYIPSDFSKNISTAGDSEKSQGTLIYNVNEKRNYLASQVLSRVTLEFKDEISKDISNEIVGTLVDRIKGVPNDLKTLDDGLKKLNSGTTEIYEKTGELINGQEQFNTGISALNKGLSDANEGSKALSSGTLKLSNGASQFYKSLSEGSKNISDLTNGSADFSAGLSTVNDGLNKLNTGVGQLSQATGELDKNMSTYSQGVRAFADGLDTYVDTVNKASDTQAAFVSSLVKYTASHPEALKDPNIQAIMNTIQASKTSPEQAKKAGEALVSSNKSLAEASEKIAAGITQINTGVNSASQNSALLSGGANKLKASYSQINGGINQVGSSIIEAATKSKELALGALSVKAGVAQLSGGIAKASDGSQSLSDNAIKIYDGEQKLKSGLGELKDGISQASEGVSSSLSDSANELNSTEGLKEYVSEPIKFTENKVNGIPDYGTAFTPYFVSLSLWVGALMMFFAIYLDPDVKFRRTAKKSRGLLRFASYSLISIAQALVLDVVILNVLHLQVKNTGLFFLASIVIALSFTSIMRFLLVQLQEVGKFIAIILLILQLTSCGGTFPMELVPDFFKVINPFMPMTYSVNALKEVISGIDYGFLTQNLLVLGVIASVLTLLYQKLDLENF